MMTKPEGEGGRHAERNSFKDKLLQDSEAIIKELRWY